MESKRLILRPIIDLEKTGEKIKNYRNLKGFSVKDLQNLFGFEYPQAIYAWEQGKTVPTIDNLLIQYTNVIVIAKTIIAKIIVLLLNTELTIIPLAVSPSELHISLNSSV